MLTGKPGKGRAVGKRRLLAAIAATAAIGGAALAPTGASGPIELEPRRNGSFPPAYLACSHVQETFLYADGTRGSERLYYLVLKRTGRETLLLTRDQLLDHYRVNAEQLSRVPPRIPIGWLSEYRKRQGE